MSISIKFVNEYFYSVLIWQVVCFLLIWFYFQPLLKIDKFLIWFINPFYHLCSVFLNARCKISTLAWLLYMMIFIFAIWILIQWSFIVIVTLIEHHGIFLLSHCCWSLSWCKFDLSIKLVTRRAIYDNSSKRGWSNISFSWNVFSFFDLSKALLNLTM